IQSKSKFPAPSEGDATPKRSSSERPEETDKKTDSTVVHGEPPEETALVEVEVEVEGGTAMPSAPPLQCPTQRIVDLYHELMPDNPRVRVLDDARKKVVAARWREAARLTTKPVGYSPVDDGISWWRTFFEVCNASDFLTGKAAPSFGRDNPFIA